VSISSASRNTPPTALTINIEGLPEMPIEALRLTDVIASGAGGLRAHHTIGLELRNVRMNTPAVPAFLISDSLDLEVDGVPTRTLRLDRCPNAVVRGKE